MGFLEKNSGFAADIISDRVAPPWLQNPVGGAYLETMGMGLDQLVYRSAQAQVLRMPGVGDPSGLYYIGLDRLIPKGPNESTASYANRLQAAFDVWQRAGSDWAVLQLALAYLLPSTPAGLIVSDTSVWSDYGANATPATKPPTHLRYQGPSPSRRFNWNWDAEAFDPHPSGAKAWWRFWLVLFADLTPVGNGIASTTGGVGTSTVTCNTNAAHGLTNGQRVWIDEVHGMLHANSNGASFVVTVTGANQFTYSIAPLTIDAAYTSGGVVYLAGPNNWVGPSQPIGTFTIGPSYTIGLSIQGNASPSALISGERSIVSNWKAANAWCRYMIISFDNGFYQPDQPSGVFGGANPDGTYGPWAYPSGGVYVCTRNSHSRYADGVA